MLIRFCLQAFAENRHLSELAPAARHLIDRDIIIGLIFFSAP